MSQNISSADLSRERPPAANTRQTPRAENMKRHQDLIIGLIVMTLAIAGLAWLIPAGVQVPARLNSPLLSPDFWPRILAGLLLAMGLLISIMALRNRQQPPTEDASLTPITAQSRNKGIAFVIGLFVYYLAILWLGIVLASVLALIGFMLLGGQRRWWPMLLTAVLLPVLVYTFFVHIARIPMPLGLFEQWL